MYFLQITFILAGLSLTLGAPADPELAKQQLQEDLSKAFEPVETQLRSLVDNAKVAINDLGNEAAEARSNIAAAAKELFNPIENTDRANIGNEVKSRVDKFYRSLQENAKHLIDRATADSQPIIESERAAMFGLRDALTLLEKKYLTDDGQALAKAVATVFTRN